MNTPTTDFNVNTCSLLEQAIIVKATDYLHNEVKKAMEKGIRKIAVDTVAAWATVEFSNGANEFSRTNINVTFIEKVLKTRIRKHSIQITVKE